MLSRVGAASPAARRANGASMIEAAISCPRASWSGDWGAIRRRM